QIVERFLALARLVLRRELSLLLKFFHQTLQLRHSHAEAVLCSRFKRIGLLGGLRRLRFALRKGLADFAQALFGFAGPLLFLGWVLRLARAAEPGIEIHFVLPAQRIA